MYDVGVVRGSSEDSGQTVKGYTGGLPGKTGWPPAAWADLATAAAAVTAAVTAAGQYVEKQSLNMIV